MAATLEDRGTGTDASREDPALELIVLGSGTILPARGRSPAGYALCFASGAVTFLDAGPGTLARFGEQGGRLEDLQRICLSHFHPDHCLDLAAVLFARRNPELTGLAPLEIIGPVGTVELLRGLRAVWGSWVDIENTSILEVVPGQSIAREDFNLRVHSSGHTENSLCLSIECGGGERLAYSGDADLVPGLVECAGEADLFVCECSFPDGHGGSGHLSPARVAEAAARARARRVLLTHFYPSCDPDQAVQQVAEAFDGAVSAARDGMRVAVAAGQRAR